MALADLARSAAATLTSLAADLDELAKDLDSLEADSAANQVAPVVPLDPTAPVEVAPGNPTDVPVSQSSSLADPPEVVATANDMREIGADNTTA